MVVCRGLCLFLFCLFFLLSSNISTKTRITKHIFQIIHFLVLTGPVSTVDIPGRIITALLVLTVLIVECSIRDPRKFTGCARS